MSGHVVYACACLNIKLHLANKYLLDNHDRDRADCFVRLDDPSIEGRQFELGMGGVQAEYNTLLTTRLIGNDLGWMTVSCLNCSTGDVYSIQRPTSTNERFTETYPVDIHSLYRTGDRVIIHDNTVYGSDIDKIKQRQNYSHNFHIILNTDALQKKDAEFDDKSNNIPGDLYSQHGQLRDILEKSLKQMQQSTEQRIEQFRQDQLQQLERASTQAKCDRDFLWQKILEAARTVNEEKQLRKRLSDPDHDEQLLETVGGHVRFAEQEQPLSSSAGTSYSTTTTTRPIVQQQQQQQQPPSTSSFIAPSSLRKASFALDERVITSSWKNTSHFHQQGLGGLRQDNVDNHDTTLLDRINNNDDHEDDGSDDGLFDLDEEIDNEEEEDIAHESSSTGDKHATNDSTNNGNTKSTTNATTTTTTMSASYQGKAFDWSKKRKSNTKYLSTYEEDDDEEPESRTRRLQDRSNDTLSTSVSAYASSMPIAISHNNDNAQFSDTMKQMADENKAVNPADQDPTTSSSNQKNDAQQNNKENTTPATTVPTGSSVARMQAYDQFSLADQEASKLFPTAYLERRRKSVAATGATPRPQLDSLIGQSLDTRQRRHRSPSITALAARNNHNTATSNSSNSLIASSSTDQYLSRHHHETNSDDEQEVGPMVPPHILAASTYTDETEELFGAVPRSNTWRKTYD